jgi:hypothetical protein
LLSSWLINKNQLHFGACGQLFFQSALVAKAVYEYFRAVPQLPGLSCIP